MNESAWQRNLRSRCRVRLYIPEIERRFTAFGSSRFWLSHGNDSWRNFTARIRWNRVWVRALRDRSAGGTGEFGAFKNARSLSEITLPAGVSKSSGPGTQAAKQHDCRDFRAVPPFAYYRR